MSRQYVTPTWLRRVLEDRLGRAGFEHPVCSKVRYGAAEDGRPALITSVFRYSSRYMPIEELEGYQRVLQEMPGVVATRIVHEDPSTVHGQFRVSLRDQVYVTFLRTWEEPDPEPYHEGELRIAAPGDLRPAGGPGLSGQLPRQQVGPD